jgi:hypothetical protein
MQPPSGRPGRYRRSAGRASGRLRLPRGTDLIRIIVAHELPKTKNNALLHLISASPDQVRYGVEHYQQHSADTSTLLGKLFEGYKREGLTMPYTMQDFRRDYVKEHLKDLTLEERLEGVSHDKIEKFLQQHKQKPSPPKRKGKKNTK